MNKLAYIHTGISYNRFSEKIYVPKAYDMVLFEENNKQLKSTFRKYLSSVKTNLLKRKVRRGRLGGPVG